jgi:hypothetical protein
MRRRGRDQRAAPGVVEFQHVGDAGRRRQLVGQVTHLRPADEQARLRVGEEVAELVALISRIQRQEDHARANRGEIQHQRFRRLFHLRRDAVARLQAKLDDQVGHARRCALDVAVGPHPPVGQDHAGCNGVLGEMRGEQGIQVLVHLTFSGSHMTISGNIASSTI